MTQPAAVPPVIVATDLTPSSDLAIVRGRAHADATGAPLVVCHVVPDVLRHHPLVPRRDESDAVHATDLLKRAADLVSEQIDRVLGAGAGEYSVAVETGTAPDEIVRLAEQREASMVTVGGKPDLGHVAERVVRYTHASVLVARPGPSTRRILVATDFAEGSLPAMRLARTLIQSVGVEGVLIHVMQVPSSVAPAFLSPLGSVWMPPTKESVDRLKALGKSTLEGLAKEYAFARSEQIDGDPVETLLTRAAEIEAEMILVGSRGHTGLRRLVLGSVAERVVRGARCSVLVAR